MNLRKYRFLAVTILTAVIFSTAYFTYVSADEGMYMMDKLARLPLKEKGLKISPDQIYNANGTGLSVAVPRLSIGCSSEFVSPDGLILTNHHCGFDALVSASTEAKNYGELGYRAANRSEELPAKGYAVDITLREEDITSRVLDGVDRNNSEAVSKRIDEIQKSETAKMGKDIRVQIQPLNGGMFYYLFAYQRVEDIRIVYAPPKSIGFYGGDPDNFEWTRHVGDFTFMRAYVAPDGTSAEYSKDNVPFKPKKYLTLSTDGVKEGDFTMIIGYPGGTNRYRESYSIAFNRDYSLPNTIESLTKRIEGLETIARANPEKAVELQSDIFGLNNSLKAETGGLAAIRRAGLVKQREADEAKLMAWIGQDATRKAKYGDALPGLKAAYDEYRTNAAKDLTVQNIYQISPAQLILAAQNGVPKERLQGAIPQIAAEQPASNIAVLEYMLRRAADLPDGQKIEAVEKRFGNLKGAERVRAEENFAEKAFAGDMFTTEKGLNELINMNAAQMKSSNNEFVKFVSEVAPDIAAITAHQQKLNVALGKYRLPFMEAMAEFKGVTPYPDANFTQRLTYGEVKGYMPKESVTYAPFTTLDGVFEKDTGIEPFAAPAKLRQLWENKDYGKYAVNGTIPVDFLTTNDIIGGNSGSPVLNANGEQVGIAFDGNYEGLGDDFFFNPKLGRTIVVDIRYVLYLTDKFGDASWIFKEMNIKGNYANAMKAGS